MLYLKQRFADFLGNDVDGAPTHMSHLISHRKSVEIKRRHARKPAGCCNDRIWYRLCGPTGLSLFSCEEEGSCSDMSSCIRTMWLQCVVTSVVRLR